MEELKEKFRKNGWIECEEILEKIYKNIYDCIYAHYDQYDGRTAHVYIKYDEDVIIAEIGPYTRRLKIEGLIIERISYYLHHIEEWLVINDEQA